jgi:hypothetical protein
MVKTEADVNYRSEQARRYAELEGIFLDFVRSRMEAGKPEPLRGSITVTELLKYCAGETREPKEAADGRAS